MTATAKFTNPLIQNDFTAGEVKDFTVSLSKAHTITQRLHSLIGDENNEMRDKIVRHITALNFTDGELLNHLENHRNGIAMSLNLARIAIEYHGKIRAIVGETNSEIGISLRLAEIQALHHENRILQNNVQRVTPYQKLESAILAAEQFKDTPIAEIEKSQSFAIISMKDLEDLNAQIKANNRKVQQLKDEIAEKNHTVKVRIQLPSVLAEIVGLI